ncbi:putative bifunctional diguanylate cyclase/phosphodiesterase [Aestuariibacter salexigens]|uniref:putative bifunctional diguanylate cyclase/phosphodiesterase n=1 Tax=Aestuariibacter salexigens TaxID=226010 RepID=UPI0003F5045A|nr:bifunctional diguanylate cyclase/phosphodiesterase [Aestuariibacter salexigens]
MKPNHQSLATIPNRYAFLDVIDNAVGEHRELSLMLIDVVRFSDVSTSFGHAAGDTILLQIANRIAELFGDDALLGRVSGDVFGLVLFGRHTQRQLHHHYTHLIEHFKTPIFHADHAFIADFNVGAVTNTKRNHDTTLLISRAEAALKQAKENKYENFQLLSLLEKSDTSRSLTLKADLKRAFANDELELYFQPKVDLQTLKVQGAECLLRWNHPLDGVLFPGALIEAAESYNMMNELGYWTLEQAIKSAADFKAQGLDMLVSVNMSPTQLYDIKFASTLIELSNAYNVDMKRLQLELTEDVALSNSLMVKKQLAMARAMGTAIAIDDFGKGYSNLAYIRDMTIDTLKIDKTFVMELENNPVNAAIIQAAQVIGKSLDCEVVAEGIETMQQLHTLRELGINTGQGYLFSRAVPKDAFIQLAQSELAIGRSKALDTRAG